MSNYSGNDQELAYSQPEYANNDKQKEKPLTAFVQIASGGPTNPVKVQLSQDYSTVAEHATFLLGRINQSRGNRLGLRLNGPVELTAVSKDDFLLMEDNIPLEEHSKYIFKFKLVNGGEYEEDDDDEGPDPVEELAMQMAHLAREKRRTEKIVHLLTVLFFALMAMTVVLVMMEDKQQGHIEQLEKRVETQEKQWEKHQKQLEEEEGKAKLAEEQRMASAEYARLIGVPNVTNLKAHYNKEKLLQLIEHGFMPSIYIQGNQRLSDKGLLQSIVDLLVTAEKPAQLVGKITIESDKIYFDWPKRDELKLKGMKSKVSYKFNEASASPKTKSDRHVVEYELINRGCHFQVLIYYVYESHNNISVDKFIYRRLP